MSDQTFGRGRGVGVNNCVHIYCGPGVGHTVLATCQRRHGPKQPNV